MTQDQKLILLYETAMKYLYEIKPDAINDEEMARYFFIKKCNSKAEILERMLFALSEHSYASIINYNKRKDAFREIFLNYDANAILSSYTPETLLNRFAERLAINIERPNSIFSKYAKTVIDTCKFINGFANENDFDKHVQPYLSSVEDQIRLADQIASAIYNCGFTLACNALKDLGYIEYAKPDTHIISILHTFSLCDNKPKSAFRIILEMARAVGDTPFNVDRIFWMIGSGDFYLHETKVKTKNAFISRAKALLEQKRLCPIFVPCFML